MNITSTTIVAGLMLLILWFIAYDCGKALGQRMTKPAIIIFTFVATLIIMSVYLYFNWHHCYSHISIIDLELIILLILIAAAPFLSSHLFEHVSFSNVFSK